MFNHILKYLFISTTVCKYMKESGNLSFSIWINMVKPYVFIYFCSGEQNSPYVCMLCFLTYDALTFLQLDLLDVWHYPVYYKRRSEVCLFHSFKDNGMHLSHFNLSLFTFKELVIQTILKFTTLTSLKLICIPAFFFFFFEKIVKSWLIKSWHIKVRLK